MLSAGEMVREEFAGRRPLLYVPVGDGPRVLKALNAAFSCTPQPSTPFAATFQVSEYQVTDVIEIGAL